MSISDRWLRPPKKTQTIEFLYTRSIKKLYLFIFIFEASSKN